MAVGDEVLASVLVGEPSDALVLEAHGTPAAAVVVAIAERFGGLYRASAERSVWDASGDSAAVRARALSLNVLRYVSDGLRSGDDVGAVLAWPGDVAAITASGDRCALRELACAS